MIECIGVRPLCSDGKPAICNTTTGEWECPAIITLADDTNDAKEINNSNGGDE